MDNRKFLEVVTESFKTFLATSSRSNEKLKILHSAIAKDLKERLNKIEQTECKNKYDVYSLGLNGENGKEQNIEGRYIDKKVDITIKKEGKNIAGIGVKFVMQNYSQNSNNYFENMLGETANIRCNKIPYFQIFIIPEELPYYNSNGNITHMENFTSHNNYKYKILSNDNTDTYFHTPNKTLLFVIKLPTIKNANNKTDYIKKYKDALISSKVEESTINYTNYNSSVIYNDYEAFAKKVVYSILAL